MMKLLKPHILTFFAGIVFSGICKAQEFSIVKGTQRATIVVSTSASPAESYAAKELQRAVRLMSGVELSIANNAAKVQGAQIIIGNPRSNETILKLASAFQLTDATEEKIIVQRKGNALYLAGNTPRAALYATYTFLQDVLGVRWLWPGEAGEFIPQRKTITVSDINITESPTLKIRSLAVTAGNGDEATDVWMARNKLNIVSSRPGTDTTAIKKRREKGFEIRIAGHNIILPVELLQKHPEYLPEIGGKRQFHPRNASHLCWSNTALQKEVAKMVASWWDQSPYPEVIHFYPADQTQYCTCEPCKNMGDISTRWQKFSNAIIAEANKTHPAKRYWTYAYLEYKPVPQTTPAPFEFIGYALYDASYRHLLSSGNEHNKLPVGEIDGWLSKGVNLGVRGYEYIIFNTPMFVPMVSWVNDQVRWLHSKKMTGYLSELPAYGHPQNVAEENTYWMCNRMALYAATKSMWKSSITADSLVYDWCNTVYGPAANDMISYYQEIEKAWMNNPEKISVFTHPPASYINGFLTPELFQKFYSHFSDAFAKIEGMADTEKRARIQTQISLERKMLDNWQSIYNLKYARAGRYKTDVVKLSGDVDSEKNLQTKLPAFENKEGVLQKNETEVSLAWTPQDFLLRIVYADDKNKNFKTGNLSYNANGWKEEGLEILVQPDKNKPHFTQLTINADGTISNAKTYGGINYAASSDIKWSASASTEKDAWVIEVRIPFSSLGIMPKDSAQFKMAVKRKSASASQISGWPDAHEAHSSNFGLVTLLNTKPQQKQNRIVLYDAGTDSSPLSVELQQRGWDVAIESADETALKQLVADAPSSLLIRYQTTGNKEFALSSSFMSKDVKSYVEKGGVAFLVANGEVPIHKWFPELPAVKWSGTKHAPVRKAAYVLQGEWLQSPNNIADLLNKGVSPVSGYTPESEGWNVLAKISMADGSEKPFLLTKKLGKGLLVLTSSPMGYSGGYDMFGNRNVTNVSKLIENLQATLRSGSNTQ